MKKYSIIYADPPWQYRTYSKKGQGRSAESHYPTMSIDDIKALPVGCRFVNDELHIRKRIKNIFGRHPVERSHGESVIASLSDSKLLGKVIE